MNGNRHFVYVRLAPWLALLVLCGLQSLKAGTVTWQFTNSLSVHVHLVRFWSGGGQNLGVIAPGATYTQTSGGWPTGSAGFLYSQNGTATPVPPSTTPTYNVSGATSFTVTAGPDSPGWFSPTAPPTDWCYNLLVENRTAFPQQYIIFQDNGGGSVSTMGDAVTVQPGQSELLQVGPESAKIDLFATELPQQNWTYVGDGQYADPTGREAWKRNISASDPGWSNCASPTTNNVSQNHRGPGLIPADQIGTNAAIYFSSTSATNTNQTLREGFNGIATINLQGLERLDTKLAQGLAGDSNRLGALNSIDGTLKALLTNGIGGAGTNFGNYSNVLGAILTNVSESARISQGGGISNSVMESFLSDAVTRGASSNGNGWASTLDEGITEGNDALASVGGAFGTLGADALKVTYDAGGLDWTFSFDPRDSAIVMTLAEWLRLALEAALVLGFFVYCFQRSQSYMWPLFNATAQRPLTGGAVTEVGNRTLGYLVVTATMAALAAVPGVFVTFVTNHGGWTGAFSLVGNLLPSSVAGTGSDKVVAGLQLANLFFPVELAITQFLTGIVFELTIAKVAIIALTIVRFLKVFSIALMLAGAQSQAIEIAVHNFSGGPVTNTSGGNVYVYPEGVRDIHINEEESQWDWIGGTTLITPGEGDVIRFSAAAVEVIEGQTAMEIVMWGFGTYTAFWMVGWKLRAVRRLGREAVSAGD